MRSTPFLTTVLAAYAGACAHSDRPPPPREERRVVTRPRPSQRAALAQQAAPEHAASPADLQVWVSTDHAGHWGSGASVVVAASEMEAHVVLSAALAERGLSTAGFTLQPLPLDQVQALILCDGDR